MLLAAVVVVVLAVGALTVPGMKPFIPFAVVVIVAGFAFLLVHALNWLLGGAKYTLVVIGIGLLVIGALWYLLVYETAEGKRHRGDLNACVVWQSQQGP